MAYWKITLLDEPVWNGRMWEYSGVPSVSRVIEYGDSPTRDKRFRLKFIEELAAAGANFTVERIET